MTNEYNDYLQHYGVIGMKWGVRKYQSEKGNLTEEGKKRYSKEYSKATKHLIKLDAKAAKGAAASTNRAKAKVAKLQAKGTKLEAKAAKAGKKEVKLENKLNKSGWRNQKQIDKYAKYKAKSAKLQAKGSKFIAKSAKLNETIKKGEAQYEKYTKKGSKFYDQMLKSFGDMPVSMFSASDVQTVAALGKKYGK